jgi:putative transposase
VSDTEWDVISSLLPEAKTGGRPRTTPLRHILNAVSYISRSGCSWRMLPKDFPPYQTVYDYFRNWRNDGTWERIHDLLREQVREREGREASPSAAIIDSQSAKTTEKGGPGGMTQGKRSKAGSGTSSLTRSD